MSKCSPLKGIKIVDLTAMVSGPTATMLLGEQGADVIKIEPLEGELMRSVGDNINGMSNSFFCCNRNKRSLTLNLKNKKGISILNKLVLEADVFIQNFRPGVIERMGLGYNKIKKIKKNIIYLSISGFGDKGPYYDQRVYDPVIQALSGLADIQKNQNTKKPKMIRTIIPDKTTGLAAAQAISTALFYRERSGIGQHIKIAMLDIMIAFLWPEGSSSLSFVGKETDPAKGQLGLDLVFLTKDKKFITAGAVSDREWLGMCKALERNDLIKDERFKTPQSRVTNKVARRIIIKKEINKFNRDIILNRFREEQVPSAPILNRIELLENEQVKANNIFKYYKSKLYGKVRFPRSAASFSKGLKNNHILAPLLGMNSINILRELNYSKKEINGFLKEKITSEFNA